MQPFLVQGTGCAASAGPSKSGESDRTTAAPQTKKGRVPLSRQPTSSWATPPPAQPVRGGTIARPSKKPVEPTSSNTGTPAPSASSNAVVPTMRDQALVQNLKRQIECLTLQVQCLKDRLEVQGERLPMTAPSAELVLNTPALVAHVDPQAAPEVEKPPVRPLTPSTQVSCLETVPEPYLTELASLRLQLETTLVDFDHAQCMCLQLEREKSQLGADFVTMKSTLQASQQQLHVLTEEHRQALDELNAEQGLRRNREVSLDGGSVKTPVGAKEVVHQRDFYKVQAERMKVQLNLQSARVKSLEQSLEEERREKLQMESKWRGAMDKCAHEEAKNQRQREYYDTLTKRFVTMAAVLETLLSTNSRRSVEGHCEAKQLDMQAEVRSWTAQAADHNHSASAQDAQAHSGPPHPSSIPEVPVALARSAEPAVALPLPETVPITADLPIPVPPAAAIPAPPVAAIPAPPAAAIPAPPAAAIPAPPVAAIPAPPVAAIPAPPAAAIPAPPVAAIPAPPVAAIPAPPAAAIPAPPVAAIPAPPVAAIPVPPSASLPVPPIATIPLPPPAATSVPLPPPPPPGEVSLQQQLQLLEMDIESEEACLRALVAAPV